MFTRKQSTGQKQRRISSKRALTLYEANLLRRYPDIAPEVLDAWSEGR
jgi:hypothetical protein